MGFPFDVGGALKKAGEAAAEATKVVENALNDAGGVVAEAAGTATKAVGDVAGAAVKTAGEAADAAGKTAGDIAGAVAGNVASTGEAIASSDIGKAAAGIMDVVGATAAGAAENVAHVASDAAAGVAGMVDSGIKAIKENSFSAHLRKARINGFRDGINQGAYLTSEKRYNYYYAYVATLCFFLRADGDYSEGEENWLRDGLEHLKLEGGLPDEVKNELWNIANNDAATFDDVKTHLDKVSIVSLDSIAECAQIATELDGEVAEGEANAQRALSDYIDSRTSEGSSSCDAWADIAIQESVREYGENIDRINEDFRNKTKLQNADIAFLMGATMLQVARVLIINALTTIEGAGGANKKEKNLHKAQDSLFKKFDGSSVVSEPDRLYAPTKQILSTHGVPYDVTKSVEGSSFGLFKGANHRFATLGHDPLLGIVFGTSNILTNSITCVKDVSAFGFGINVPVTHSVLYDSLWKNPQIGDAAGTIEMLSCARDRIINEPEAGAAALIKQIIHIHTDLYTPCGIQIPFANVVLDKAHAEKLTKYVSTGDIMKVGAQAGVAYFINWLVAALHGLTFIFNNDESEFATETYQVRTKKIILLSDTIATSSSVVQSAVLKNPKCLDIGGAAVLVYRLFTDGGFIAKLKEEYVNAGLNDIYEQRARGLLH